MFRAAVPEATVQENGQSQPREADVDGPTRLAGHWKL
jgi:hypothetical protein